MKLVTTNGIIHAVIEIDLENVPDYTAALLEIMQLTCVNKVEVDPVTMDNLLQLVKYLQFSPKQTGHIALKRETALIPEE